jgi:RNA binding exosome subunit
MFEDLQKVLPGNTAHEILPVAGYVLTIEEYYEQKIRNLTKEHEISTIMDEITERNKLTNVTVERDNLLERIDVQKHYYLKQIAIVSQKAVLEVYVSLSFISSTVTTNSVI